MLLTVFAVVGSVPLPLNVFLQNKPRGESLEQSFLQILRATMQHLAANDTTVGLQREMLTDFYDRLSETERSPARPCTNATISEYFSNHDLRVYLESSYELKWGWVSKSGEDADKNELGLLRELFEEWVDSEAPSEPASPVTNTTFLFLIIVTLIHEFRYCLTKFVFGAAHTTPNGVGPTMHDGFGESGWLIEDRIFEGILGAEWTRGKRGNMKHLKGLTITMLGDDQTIFSLPETYMRQFNTAILSGRPDRLPLFDSTDAVQLSPSLGDSDAAERSRLSRLKLSGSPPTSPQSSPPRLQREPQGLGIVRTGRIPDRLQR